MAEMHAPLVKVAGLSRYFDVSAPWLNRVLDGQPRLILKAVDGLDFEINRGETLALVGESGCGKSTVARLVVGLYRPSAGSIVFDGVDMAGLGGRAEMAPIRRRLQMIFQDPFASLNPRWRVSAIVSEPIRAFRLLDDERLIVEHGLVSDFVPLSSNSASRSPSMPMPASTFEKRSVPVESLARSPSGFTLPETPSPTPAPTQELKPSVVIANSTLKPTPA